VNGTNPATPVIPQNPASPPNPGTPANPASPAAAASSGAPVAPASPATPVAEAFQQHRDLLLAVAYRMLGTVADAEDTVQDSWIRWSSAPRDEVADPKAYLVRIVTNTSLDRLRSARARREAYIGPWLPEPVLTDPDVADRAELAESVSLAMLVVLESLTPDERAVFVLREVFGFRYAEIAGSLGRSEAGVRQLAHRAREHVQARRPRFEVDRSQQQEVTRRFLAAAMGADLDGLLAVLAPDVELITDGGGKAKAAIRPIRGAARVASWIKGIAGRSWQGYQASEIAPSVVQINGGTGVLLIAGGHVLAALTATVADDRITAIHLVANPDKLRAISAGRALPM
jgi:RNA polymerase sigma-70 factor (TIGR02957 family)